MITSFARRLAPFCALAIAVSLAGCGFGHKQTVYTGNGSVTVSSDGQNDENKTVTVNGNGGSMSIGSGAVDTSKLGAPVYPGATQDQNGGLTMSTDKGTSVTAIYKTSDDFSKVESYYKSQLPANSEKMNMSAGTGSLATFQIGDDTAADQTTVTITSKEGDQTSILLSHITKNASASASASPGASPTDQSSPAATASP